MVLSLQSPSRCTFAIHAWSTKTPIWEIRNFARANFFKLACKAKTSLDNTYYYRFIDFKKFFSARSKSGKKNSSFVDPADSLGDKFYSSFFPSRDDAWNNLPCPRSVHLVHLVTLSSVVRKSGVKRYNLTTSSRSAALDKFIFFLQT